MVADTNDVQRVILEFVFDEPEEFTLVLKPSIHSLETTTINRVRKGDRDPELYGMLFAILISVELVIDLVIGVNPERPKHNIVSAHVEQEDQEKRYRGNPFQGKSI